MLFKNFSSVGSAKYFTKFKGKSSGRLNSYNFDKHVRKPFSDKVFQQSYTGKRNSYKYNVYDSQVFYQDRVGSHARRNSQIGSIELLRRKIRSESPRNNKMLDKKVQHLRLNSHHPYQLN